MQSQQLTTPDVVMPNKKPLRRPPTRSKALLLPMPSDRASDLILRSRIFLERARNGDIDRGLINHLAQVCIISGYVARTGHGRLPPEAFELVEQQLARLLLDFDATGTWSKPSARLLEGLTDVINEYDRTLGTVRLEIVAKASDHLDRLMEIAASGEPHTLGNQPPASTSPDGAQVCA
jgi:hypothetical protein